MDASTWFLLYMFPPPDNENTPIPLALFDAGFDVWVGSNRGTQYNRLADLDPSDGAYWDFVLGDYSLDVKAFITGIQEQNVREKVNYIRYSLGTMQIFYALS